MKIACGIYVDHFHYQHYVLRSQSVYSKSSSAGGAAVGSVGVTTAVGGVGAVAATSLATAQSLLLRPPHTVTMNQNVHNAQRDPAYGTTANGVRPGPAGTFISCILALLV